MWILNSRYEELSQMRSMMPNLTADQARSTGRYWTRSCKIFIRLTNDPPREWRIWTRIQDSWRFVLVSICCGSAKRNAGSLTWSRTITSRGRRYLYLTMWPQTLHPIFLLVPSRRDQASALLRPSMRRDTKAKHKYLTLVLRVLTFDIVASDHWSLEVPCFIHLRVTLSLVSHTSSWERSRKPSQQMSF